MTDLCHLCEQPLTDAITVGRKARHGDDQHNVCCRTCGLVQQVPHATEAELDAYYAGPYREQYKDLPVAGLEPGTPEYERHMDTAAERYAATICGELGLTSGARVLEVGCGDGRLSAAIGRRGAWVEAVEPGDAKREQARARGVRVSSAASFVEHLEHWAVDERWDAFVAVHVLEHFARPLAALSAMWWRLDDDGQVWIEVPNVEQPYGPLEGHYFQKPHVVNFSPATLAIALLRAGFDDVMVAASGTVILSRARKGTPRTYAEALARFVEVSGAQPPTADQVVAGLAEYERRRVAREGSATRALQRWLAGEIDAAEAERCGVRGEVAWMADVLSYVIDSGGGLSQALDAESEAEGERWYPRLWNQGFQAGRVETLQQVNVALSHWLNGVLARATR